MPKILVIDDDTRLRNLLSKYLLDNGFEVKDAKDSFIAEEILSKENFDILLIDVMMPKKDGIELTASIRKSSDVPIIILTAKNESTDRIKGLEAGADDYMHKPFEPKEILLRINNILKRSSK